MTRKLSPCIAVFDVLVSIYKGKLDFIRPPLSQAGIGPAVRQVHDRFSFELAVNHTWPAR